MIDPQIGSPSVEVTADKRYATKRPCHDNVIDAIKSAMISTKATIVSDNNNFFLRFNFSNNFPDITNKRMIQGLYNLLQYNLLSL